LCNQKDDKILEWVLLVILMTMIDSDRPVRKEKIMLDSFCHIDLIKLKNGGY